MHCTTCRQTIVCTPMMVVSLTRSSPHGRWRNPPLFLVHCIVSSRDEFYETFGQTPSRNTCRSICWSVGWYIGSSCRNFCLCLLLWFLRGLRVHQRSQVPESEQSRPQLMPTVTQSRPDAMDAGWLFDRSSDAPASGHFSRRKPENQ